MSYVVHSGPCCCPVVTWVSDGINMFDITTLFAQALDNVDDIIFLSIQLKTGANTKEGVDDINYTTIQNEVFADYPDALLHLNTVVKSALGLVGKFNISAQNYINYSNEERFDPEESKIVGDFGTAGVTAGVTAD